MQLDEETTYTYPLLTVYTIYTYMRVVTMVAWFRIGKTSIRIPTTLYNYSSSRVNITLCLCKLILSRCSMYTPRRLVDELPLLVLVAGGEGKISILESNSSSEPDEKKTLTRGNIRSRGRHANMPIRRINAMIYEDEAMLKAQRTGDIAEPSLSSRASSRNLL